MLDVEYGYTRYQRGEITYEEYRTLYADPADAAIARMKRRLRR